MAQYIEFTPEQKERAATVDLEEFLLQQGEKLIKSGREKRLASDHSVTVRGCEWFDHASNEGGRAVSFVQKYYGKSYAEAMSMLLGESMEPVYPQAKKQEQVDQKPFAPPVPNANMHRVFAYLLKTRGLDADVVSYFARKKMLYEDTAHHNAVFIGTDEGGCPRHAHLRSTNSFGKAFRLNVESSDPRYSFHHTGTDGSLYVFEAPIDMLSYTLPLLRPMIGTISVMAANYGLLLYNEIALITSGGPDNATYSLSYDTDYKPASMLIRKLVECVSKGGNMILNVGPDANGRFNAESCRLLDEIGAWMSVNSESIYGCGSADVPKPDWGWYTKKSGRIYAHILENPIGPLALTGLDAKRVGAVRRLADGSEVLRGESWITNAYENLAFVTLGTIPHFTYLLPDTTDTVLAIEYKEDPQ